MSQHQGAGGGILILIFAVYAIWHENAAKIKFAVSSFFDPIFIALGKILLWGAYYVTIIIVIWLFLREVNTMWINRKKETQAEKERIDKGIIEAQEDAKDALYRCAKLHSQVEELKKFCEDLKNKVQEQKEMGASEEESTQTLPDAYSWG